MLPQSYATYYEAVIIAFGTTVIVIIIIGTTIVVIVVAVPGRIMVGITVIIAVVAIRIHGFPPRKHSEGEAEIDVMNIELPKEVGICCI